MEYFCPVCGSIISPLELDFYKKNFICTECHDKKSVKSTSSNQYIVHICTMCFAYVFGKNPKNAQWKQKNSQDVDDALKQILRTELKLDESYTIDIPAHVDVPSKFPAIITKNSKITDELVILVKAGMCKNCNKMVTRRFDAVIQLRTIKLKSKKAEEILHPILTDIIDYSTDIHNKNPEQFISDIDMFSHGVDLKLSNKAIMNSILSYLNKKYPLIVKSSKKLMGKNPNTGGDLYRTYLLLRYLPFVVNTQIRIKNDYFLIKKIQANRISLENIANHHQHMRNYDYFEKKLIELIEG